MAPPEGAEAVPATTVVVELLKALKEFKSSPTDILRPPTFDWNSTDPYEDFRLFIKGMNSWFTLNALPDEDGKSTVRLEYLLNFLGPNGRRKHEQWTPRGDSEAERSRKKKSAKEFLEYLHSTMDHPVSQQCRIYQLEEIRIRPGETHDELVERIRNLADRCNFPSEAEKERHVQFRLVRALNDADLVRKLLMLKLDAPTSEMLSICQTHSALDTGLTEMGLREKKVNAVQKTAGRRRQQPPKGQCGNCTKKHPSGRDNCPVRDATCHGCGNKGHWKTKCRKSQKADKGQTSRRPQHPKKPKGRRTDEIDVDQDEITVA